MAKLYNTKDIRIDAFINSGERFCRDRHSHALLPEKLPELENRIKDALAKKPHSLKLHEYYAVCLIRQDKTFEAKWHWQDVLKDNTDNIEAQLGYNNFLMSAFKLGAASKDEVVKQAEDTYRLPLSNEQKILLNERMSALSKLKGQNIHYMTSILA